MNTMLTRLLYQVNTMLIRLLYREMVVLSKMLEKVNYNAYKTALLSEYYALATFNVNDLSPYLEDNKELDLRTNSFQEGKNDVSAETKSLFKTKKPKTILD